MTLSCTLIKLWHCPDVSSDVKVYSDRNPGIFHVSAVTLTCILIKPWHCPGVSSDLKLYSDKTVALPRGQQ